MSYLYLNFEENLNRGSKSWDDFYTKSLMEQYESLRLRLGKNAPETIELFVGCCCPMDEQNYYVSMPSFDRKIQQNRRGKDCIYNIIIRPERSEYMSGYIPENYDVIFIGDVTFGSVIDVTVKGIELIDSAVAKFGETKVYCMCACAFQNKAISIRPGETINVADFGVREIHDSVLTHDFVNRLCKETYPIPNPETAIKVFHEWNQYLDFRNYYLGEQSEKHETLADVSVKRAYVVTQKAYRRHKEDWEPFLLDGHAEFSQREQVFLQENVEESEELPLICVAIEKNRKEILMDTVGRGDRSKSKYEVFLRRFTKDSMGLSESIPRYDEHGFLIKGQRFTQFLLGEREAFTHIDLGPDCFDLEQRFGEDLSAGQKNIDDKYNSIILDNLDEFMSRYESSIQAVYERKLSEYLLDLEENLEKDILENKNKDIHKQIENLEKAARDELKEKFNEQKKRLEGYRKEIKKNKELSKEERKKAEQNIAEQLRKLNDELRREQEEACSAIDIRALYVAHHQKLGENKRKSLEIEKQREISLRRNEMHRQLQAKYAEQIRTEKQETEDELRADFEKEKAERIENETIRRFEIYFHPENTGDSVKDVKKDLKTDDFKYLTYDNRAEKAKIDRQRKALQSLMGGYVKNPYLASYLFAPEQLENNSSPMATRESIDWCLESLNDSQKKAVRRALSSESIFLLQGPPGTGKTQVIAELTAQYTKQGKKVLISSETHKAIDNVFDRLPKIPEIRPLRLIPSQNGKETDYSPERLVDNFYCNIEQSLKRQVERYENFREEKENFAEKMEELHGEYSRLLRLKKEAADLEGEQKQLDQEMKQIEFEIAKARENLNLLRDDIDTLERTDRRIQGYRFDAEGVSESFVTDCHTAVQSLLQKFSCLKAVKLCHVRNLMEIDPETVKKEINALFDDSSLAQLEQKKSEIRFQMNELLDPETNDPPEEGQEGYEKYRSFREKFMQVNKQLKAARVNGAVNPEDLKISEFMGIEFLTDKNIMKLLPEQIALFRTNLTKIISEYRRKLQNEIELHQQSELNLKLKIEELKRDYLDKQNGYDAIGEDSRMSELEDLDGRLKQKINRFFRDFGIVREYNAGDFSTAFEIIEDEWKALEDEYEHNEEENKIKIPMFKDICGYLSNEDILEEDRQAYTKLLYEQANVFGITCTSRDRFTKTQLKELAKYNIESVNIRTQGIDVVIIDEVSKSSFLDLLIPILYGKTVILVGDHRQLPPMYDLRHMRDSDFEGLNPDIITKEINDRYTGLYEECFFKTLYERVPENYRVMLKKQYRCHSHIMKVFNYFYGGDEKGLEVGTLQQDDQKQHNLTVRINDKLIVEPKYHVLFIDCDEKESANDGSTSKMNPQEAEVVDVLLQKLNESAEQQCRSGRIRIDSKQQIDERPSVGVICTYGDQAGLIKRKRKGKQFKGFSGKNDERLIVSTVDDFQGDERDIILVSMVRNPKDNRFNAEFVKQFERINVAFSRARKLLIIVGAKKFLSEQLIDLPDLEGRTVLDRHSYPVYKHIIETIDYLGRTWTAQDVIGG